MSPLTNDIFTQQYSYRNKQWLKTLENLKYAGFEGCCTQKTSSAPNTRQRAVFITNDGLKQSSNEASQNSSYNTQFSFIGGAKVVPSQWCCQNCDKRNTSHTICLNPCRFEEEYNSGTLSILSWLRHLSVSISAGFNQMISFSTTSTESVCH